MNPSIYNPYLLQDEITLMVSGTNNFMLIVEKQFKQNSLREMCSESNLVRCFSKSISAPLYDETVQNVISQLNYVGNWIIGYLYKLAFH